MLMLRALTDVRTTTPRLLLFWSRYLHLISVQQQFGGCLWTVFFIEIFWIPVIFCVYFVNNAFVFFLFHFFLYSYAVSYSPYYRHMLSLFYHVHYILLCSAHLNLLRQRRTKRWQWRMTFTLETTNSGQLNMKPPTTGLTITCLIWMVYLLNHCFGNN